MKRREFLKRIPVAASVPLMINGIPLSVLGKGVLQQVAATADNDRVLVIIQLHGGNDGLNTLIPIEQYARYYDLRPNIAIANHGKRQYIGLDSTLSVENQVGLHPDMTGMKTLYDQGKVAVIQGVGYENLNQSHFRSRDIWFMGGDYNEEMDSGWMGRYLDHLYPGYPEAYPSAAMPDPLGLEIGSAVSLAFHRSNGIPAGVSIDNPNQFYNLINSVGGEPPAEIADTYYGHELQWIIDIEKKSNQYAGRLKEVYEKGSNSANVTYPETYPFNAPASSLRNGLSAQLRMIARLVSGGAKTKIYLARIGGFDTHASQVESYDASMGVHAALLYHLSESLRAFQDDLKGLGLEDRVLTVTMSEFGRRAASNDSWGTDHGTAAPMFVVGKYANPGMYGNNGDLNNLDRGNLRMQHDYRQVFGAVVQDWMQGDATAIEKTRFTEYVQGDKKMPLIRDVVLGTSKEQFVRERFRLNECTPNPASGLVQFSYVIHASVHVALNIYHSSGRLVKSLVNETKSAGQHHVQLDVTDYPSGLYLYTLQAGTFKDQKKLIVA